MGKGNHGGVRGRGSMKSIGGGDQGEGKRMRGEPGEREI